MSAVAPAAPTASAPSPPHQSGSSLTVATQMFGADFLKLRRKRGIMVWALVLAVAPILVFFLVSAIQHASEPLKYGPHGIEGYGPAGGVKNFSDGLRVVTLFFGPLANGATSVMWEGAPDYPNRGIWWEIVERYGVTILYCAPTAIRACIKWGAQWPGEHDLSTLRLLGSVGEPINPKAWLWYHKVIGGERCPIVDTWWQTETGAIMITPLPGITATKPGSATHPFPGVAAEVRDESTGEPIEEGQGLLVLTRPWPSMLRTLYRAVSYTHLWRRSWAVW